MTHREKRGKPQPKRRSKGQPKSLTGGEIAEFLAEPMSVAQRWATNGMPITRQGRSVVASPDELNKWLGRESGEPVHVATAGPISLPNSSRSEPASIGLFQRRWTVNPDCIHRDLQMRNATYGTSLRFIFSLYPSVRLHVSPYSLYHGIAQRPSDGCT